MTTKWHGDNAESTALVAAISRHCACEYGEANERIVTCAPHQAMVDDQRFLDGLLEMRHYRNQLLAQEFRVPA